MQAVSSPITANGIAITVDAESRAFALLVETGQVLWKYPWYGTPGLVADGLVFVIVGEEVHLVEPRTGRPRGCLPCGHASALYAPQGYLVFQRLLFGGGSDLLLCLDRRTGRRLWTRDVPLGSRTSPWASDGGTLFLGRDDGVLSAIDLASGATLWHRSWPQWGWHDGRSFHAAQFAGVFAWRDVVVVCAGPHVACVEARSGRAKWAVTGPLPYFAQGRLHSATDSRYEVRDARTGRVVRRVSLRIPGEEHGRLRPEHRVTLVTGDAIFIATHAGLVALDQASGRCRWLHPAADGDVSRSCTLEAAGRLLHYSGRQLLCLVPARLTAPGRRK